MLVKLHHSWEIKEKQIKDTCDLMQRSDSNSMFSEASVTCHFRVIFMPITVPSVDENSEEFKILEGNCLVYTEVW